MIKVNLNSVKQVLSEYNLPTSELNAFTKVVRSQIMYEAHRNLVEVAKERLRTSKAEYINGIVLKPNSIDLKGFLPNAIEDGLQPFDLKQSFASSPKAKRKLDGGWYLTVPFKIGTPNATNFQTIMPRDIYSSIRANKTPDLTNYPPNTRGEVKNESSNKIWEQYANKYSVYEGINATKNPNTGKNSYNTFRRVSDKSDANSWIHTGIQAHNLMDEAWRRTEIDKIIDDAIEILF